MNKKLLALTLAIASICGAVAGCGDDGGYIPAPAAKSNIEANDNVNEKSDDSSEKNEDNDYSEVEIITEKSEVSVSQGSEFPANQDAEEHYLKLIDKYIEAVKSADAEVVCECFLTSYVMNEANLLNDEYADYISEMITEIKEPLVGLSGIYEKRFGTDYNIIFEQNDLLEMDQEQLTNWEEGYEDIVSLDGNVDGHRLIEGYYVLGNITISGSEDKLIIEDTYFIALNFENIGWLLSMDGGVEEIIDKDMISST